MTISQRTNVILHLQLNWLKCLLESEEKYIQNQRNFVEHVYAYIEETQRRIRYETNPDMLDSLQLELNHYDNKIFGYERNLQNLMMDHKEFRNDILYEMQNIEYLLNDANI